MPSRVRSLRPMFIDPTQKAGALLVQRGIPGPVSMLNLLRFRDEADYSAHSGLAPDTPISGRDAYDIYAGHTMPFLQEAGGRVGLLGEGGPYLIGPAEDRWDRVMIVEYPSVEAFLGMATNTAYLAGIGHRSAALADSRLLPIEVNVG